MNFRDEFLMQRPNKTIADLKAEVKMKQAKTDLDKILNTQNQKAKIKKINSEIQRMVFG